MDNKDASKLLLCIIMGAVLILLLNVNLNNVFFHSFFTVIFLVMAICHIILNKDWIKAVTKNLTNKNFKTRYKVIYFLNLILGLSFVVLLISEIFIYHSKNFASLIYWQKVHSTVLTTVLVLVSIHVGIHLDYFIDGIKAFFKGLKNKSERKILAKFAIALAFVIIVYIPVSYYAEKRININNKNEQNTDNRDFGKMFGDEYEDNNNNNNNNNGGSIEDFFGDDDLEEFFKQFEDNNNQGTNDYGNYNDNNGKNNNSRF